MMADAIDNLGTNDQASDAAPSLIDPGSVFVVRRATRLGKQVDPRSLAPEDDDGYDPGPPPFVPIPSIKRRSLAAAVSALEEAVREVSTNREPAVAYDPGPWEGVPLVPTTIEETGLPEGFLRELVLKAIWANDRPSLTTVSSVTGLNVRVIEQVVQGLDREGLCQVDAGSAQSQLQFHYRLTDKGKNAAHDALGRSRYIGVAPVPVAAYREMIQAQLAYFRRPPFEDIRKALEHLVLPERLVRMIAQAFFSRRTLMVYGPSGNGKTEIVTSIARTAVGKVIIPYALYGQGQLIRVFDPEFHKSQVAADPGSDSPWANAALRHDRRWLPIDRPVVVVGGDMGGDALEMTYDPTLGIHHAPLSVVAQGGVLVIDDLGRQRVSPKEILNRWVLMMEQGSDTFSLSTSEVVRLPLDVTLIFSTNLTVDELVDEAYMRRIAYKIAIPNPERDELAEITRRFCTGHEIDWTEGAVQHLMDRLYRPDLPSPRGCYPRDIVTTIIDEAEFEDRRPVLDENSVDMAVSMYLGVDFDAPPPSAAAG
jgi:hypothetical protein